MSDDASKRGAPDNRHIHLTEFFEVRAWCRRFNCTEHELSEAVRAVGNSAAAVEKFLNKQPA